MSNRVIELNEQELNALVEDATKIYLSEMEDYEGGSDIEGDMEEGVMGGIRNSMRGIGNGNFHMMQNYRSGSYAGSIKHYGNNAIKSLNNFKSILTKSGAQQMTPQIDNINQELQKIINNYQTYAQNASNSSNNQNLMNTQNVNTTVPNGSVSQQNVQNNGIGQQDIQNNGEVGQQDIQNNGAEQQNVPNGEVGQEYGQYDDNEQPNNTQSGGNVFKRAWNKTRGYFRQPKRNNFDAYYQNMQPMNLSQKPLQGESRNLIKLNQNDLRGLVYETVNILMNEDGEGIGGGGATNVAGTMQGGGINPGAGTYDVPFGSVQRRNVYSPKGKKSNKMTKVNMAPALERHNGKGGSISIPKKRAGEKK